MNNQWRDGADCMVVWADETYDRSRKCDSCGLTTCSQPVHTDYYSEVGTTDLDENLHDEILAANTYWSWMHLNTPRGGKTDFDGESIAFEMDPANPDNLAERAVRTSGITEQQHLWMQEAYELLTDKQKVVWDKVQREQQPQTFVAKELGIEENTLTDRLNRARVVVTEYLRTKAEQHGA